jgi:hypothetical protein
MRKAVLRSCSLRPLASPASVRPSFWDGAVPIRILVVAGRRPDLGCSTLQSARLTGAFVARRAQNGASVMQIDAV